jgi:hypothetical protein
MLQRQNPSDQPEIEKKQWLNKLIWHNQSDKPEIGKKQWLNKLICKL